jgi:Tol biopolymer transport system component
MGNRAVRIAVLIAFSAFVSLHQADAQVVRQVTDLVATLTGGGMPDDAAGFVFAVSSTDPYGTNPEHVYQIFRWNPATGEGAQVSNLEEDVYVPHDRIPSVTDDGETVAFTSFADPLGLNPDRSQELFLIGADGHGLSQLTDTPDLASGFITNYFIAGDGSRVVFESNADYLGTNPQQVGQVWVVESDGTGLRQLTTFTFDHSWRLYPTISDDGQRITFASPEDLTGPGGNGFSQIFAVLHEGTDLRRLTTIPFDHSYYPQISGDGSTIAFFSRGQVPGDPYWTQGDQIAVINWDGTGIRTVAAPYIGDAVTGYAGPPDITDDGQVVVYPAVDIPCCTWDIYRVNKDGTGVSQLTDTYREPGCPMARVSGAGGRVAFLCEGEELYGGPNPDLGQELFAATATGTDHRQLSDSLRGDSTDPEMTPDGSRVVFVSDADPLGEPGENLPQLYRIAPDGSDLTRVTEFQDGDTEQPSVTDDGQWIVFSHSGDPLGTNGNGGYQIFAVRADGSELRQLTDPTPGTTAPSEMPRVAGDGSVVVFQSEADLLGETVSSWFRIYKVALDGTGLARLSEDTGLMAKHASVDDTGTWAVYAHDGVIHRVPVDGGTGQVLPGTSEADWPDISSDGGLVVYHQESAPGAGDAQLFVWEASSGETRQLTDTTTGRNVNARFSGDAAWIYFWSDAPHFGEDHLGFLVPFRLRVSDGTVERVGGLSSCWGATDYLPEPDRPLPIAVNTDGNLAAFGDPSNCSGNNKDPSREIVVIDRQQPASISVGPGPAPTLIWWDVESGPVRYDVIRGDLASLEFDGAGHVDLGAVVCVENDSDDNATAGDEDPDTPGPGQVFFYLYRGSQGSTAGPGSYGTASSGEERIVTDGDC